MKELVLEALATLELKKGRLEGVSAFKVLEPLGDFIRKQYGQWLRDEVAEFYALLMIQQQLETRGSLNRDGVLADVTTIEQRKEIAQALVDAWTAVPIEYRFVFPVPGMKNVEREVEIAPGVVFTNVDRDEVDSLGMTMTLSFGELAGVVPTSKVAALVVRERGLMMLESTTEVPAVAAIRKAKITLLLGVVVGVFAVSATTFDAPKFVTYTPSGGPGAVSGRVNLSPGFAKALCSIAVVRHGSLVLTHPIFAETMTCVGSVLAREGGKQQQPVEEQCARVATAAEWLFDAEFDGESATQFVQAAIALEALYGGGADEPIRNTLSNRVAYSLGKTHEQREDLRTFIHEFYDTRSRVVHRGATRLDGTQRQQPDRARQVLHQALNHELRMVGTADTGAARAQRV